MDWTNARLITANCAASLLMFALFAALAAGTVVLFGAWRTLRAARRHVSPQAVRVENLVQDASAKTHSVTRLIVAPQIAIAAVWSGLWAGLRVFLGVSRRDDMSN